MINSEQVFNASYVRSEYVGYMYTENQQHGNTTSSSIKGTIDTWYSTNLASYANYISTETGFCGDREVLVDIHGHQVVAQYIMQHMKDWIVILKHQH